jgi:predicted dienelactone hydrolase
MPFLFRVIGSLVCFSLLLTACGEDVALPPAEPLAATEAELEKIYGISSGTYQVGVVRDVVLEDSARERDLELSVFYPEGKEQFPLLLFSHGNWSDKDSYDRVIDHWVSHGYIVIAPNHFDCCGAVSGIFNSVRYGQLGLIDERMMDFSYLLDNLQEIEILVPAIKGRIDSDRIAATGHSFGAFSAQQFGGAGTFDPDQEKYLFYRDERIKAIVAMSPPGPMFDVITEKSWVEMDKPMLLTTGTWDSNKQFWPDWQLHRMSFDTASPGENYALVTQGADHYLGNLICRLERENPPQYDALEMLNAVTTAFLDAYIKDDAGAREFLQSDSLSTITGGFSTLQRR